METFVFMQTRVFRNETQIHIEKIHTRVFSLENAEVGHRKGVYRKIGGLQEKQVKKKISVQRAALALRRVQQNLILRHIIIFCV